MTRQPKRAVWVVEDVEQAREHLRVAGLASGPAETAALLYTGWYARQVPPDAVPSGPLLPAYRAAHAASESFEDVWTVHELRSDLGPGTVTAVRARERRVLAPVDYYRRDGLLAMPQPGTEVCVTARRDRVENGYWYCWTEGWARARGDPLARLYWNVPLQFAVEFVARWTADAPSFPPHMMKILVEAERFERADAAVAYLRRADIADAMPLIKELHCRVRYRLARPRPPFTRLMGVGLAFAEDPGDGTSFGEQCCRLMAEAAWADPAALSEPRRFYASVFETFRSAGLDLAQPHLTRRVIPA